MEYIRGVLRDAVHKRCGVDQIPEKCYIVFSTYKDENIMVMEFLRTALDWYAGNLVLSLSLTFAYLVMGYVFGIFSYWVAVKSQDYPYLVRLLLYPLTTVCSEGWIIISAANSLPVEIVKAEAPNFAYFAWEKKDAGEGFYAVLLAPVWVLKIFCNFLELLVLCVLTVVYVVFVLIVVAISIAALAVKRYYFVATRVCLNSARHAEGKKLV